jgi:hypothetical protein
MARASLRCTGNLRGLAAARIVLCIVAMDRSARRRLFAKNLLTGLGLATAVVPLAYACGGTAVIDENDGAGGEGEGGMGQGGTTTTTTSNTTSQGGAGAGCTETTATTSGGLTMHYSRCLDELNLPCPANESSAAPVMANVLNAECCVNTLDCESLLSVDCGPFPTAQGNCCFEITTAQEGCATPGRPLVVERALTAPLDGNAAWQRDVGTAPHDEARAARWAADGLAEHASVASFARFALELMAQGAPAELVEATHRAALDEIEHARLCFAVASAYAGRAMGPGPLPLPPELPLRASLSELAVATVEEGCINETLAALRAAIDLDAVSEPLERAALERIVADEARHAELAWRTVAWALEAGGAPVREAVAAAFARLQGSADSDVREVVLPCARALLA